MTAPAQRTLPQEGLMKSELPTLRIHFVPEGGGFYCPPCSAPVEPVARTTEIPKARVAEHLAMASEYVCPNCTGLVVEIPISISEIVEAWEFVHGLGWCKMPNGIATLRIADGGLEAEMLKKARPA